MPDSRHAEYLRALPSDWERVSLGQIGDIIGGGTPSRDNPAFWGGTIPWVTPGEITELDTEVLYDTRESITESGLEGSAARLLPPGALLITTRATIGAVAVAGVPVTTNQGFRNLICNGSANPHFYFHLLKRISGELKRLSSGSTFDEISGTDIGHILVPRPPMDEQRRIADVLNAADDAIDIAKQVIDKLQQMKQGLLQDLLTRGVDGDGKLRDPDRRPADFKSSSLGQIPVGWEIRTLAELAEVLDHLRVPVNSDERAKRPGAVPYYGANGQQGWIDVPLFDEPLVLLAEDGGNFDDYSTRPIAYRVNGPSWVNNHAHVLRAAAGVDQGFLFFALEHRDIRRYISGGTRTKLTQAELKSIQIPTPPTEEQRRISAVLDAHVRRIEHESDALKKLRLVKQGLTNALLSGLVRIPNSEEIAA